MYRDPEQRDFARALRTQATIAEKRLWHFLRAQKLGGYKFRRQAAIGAYIVDFVCFSAKLIIELDGPDHLETAAVAHDAYRTQWLMSRGFRVLRFRNLALDEDIQAVVDLIGRALEEAPLPNPPRQGEGTGRDAPAA